MLRVSFYHMATDDEPVETYEGAKLELVNDWTDQEVKLDGVHIATFEQCYDFSYFILQADYDKPNYNYGDARWLRKMVVEESRHEQPDPLVTKTRGPDNELRI